MPSVGKQFLSPLAAMLRARYPSTVRAVREPAANGSSSAPRGSNPEADEIPATEEDDGLEHPHPHADEEEAEDVNEDDKTTIGGHDRNKFLDETQETPDGKGSAPLEKLTAVEIGV